MNRRRLILEEMGITPLWRLREPAVANSDTDFLRSAGDERGMTKDIPAAESGLSVQVADSRNPTTSQRARVESAADEQRRAQILRMDWSALKASVAQCIACPLHEKRTNTVFGVGDEQADWLFVGEGPGAEEDVKGEPFVGQAGQLLDNMLAAIELKRGENVYIANVVKCRPPGNRNPEVVEMRGCEPYLTRQIKLIQPKLIVAMGRVAVSHLLQTSASIASLRGSLHSYQGTTLIVTYHPAYLLRSLPDKAKSWADLCFARETMARIQ